MHVECLKISPTEPLKEFNLQVNKGNLRPCTSLCNGIISHGDQGGIQVFCWPQSKSIHDLWTMNVSTHVYLHAQIIVDTGDISIWQTMFILITKKTTKKTQKLLIWAPYQDQNGAASSLESPFYIYGRTSKLIWALLPGSSTINYLLLSAVGLFWFIASLVWKKKYDISNFSFGLAKFSTQKYHVTFAQVIATLSGCI